VPLVPSEELVPAVAGQRDGDVTARHLREVVGRHGRGVGVGLAVVADELGQNRDQVAGLDHLFVVLGAKPRSDLAGVPSLVVGRVCEADRERAHAPAGLAHHLRDHVARVRAAAQQSPQRDVADQPRTDGRRRPAVELLDRVPVTEVELGLVVDRPVAPLAHAVRPADHQEAGPQLADALEARLGRRHVAQPQELRDRRHTDLARDRRVGEQRLQLGRERDPAMSSVGYQ
jgi:hypothetical protein